MHEPERLKQPVPLSGYLAIMSKAVFQTGISWKVVETKWAGIRLALKDFDPLIISGFGGADIDRLMQDTRLIRNRRKLEAIVLNARKMLELEASFKGFKNYLRSFDSFKQTVAALHRDFKFMGETGSYYFLWVVGEEVPPWEEWIAERGA